MTIKYLQVNAPDLIPRATKGDPRAQRLLYERYAPAMLGICRRYLRQLEDAEDALSKGFYRALTQLHKLEDSNKFSAWLKRIMINECLMMLRANKLDYQTPIDQVQHKIADRRSDPLELHDLLRHLDRLPDGYRTIFNLYAIEGYKHREIAEQLGISINTSKSQLIMARKRLQELIHLDNQEAKTS